MGKMTAIFLYHWHNHATDTAPIGQALLVFVALIMILEVPLRHQSYAHLMPFILMSLGFFTACLPIHSFFKKNLEDGTWRYFAVNDPFLSPHVGSLFLVYIFLIILPLTLMIGLAGALLSFPAPLLITLVCSFFLLSMTVLMWGSLASLLSAHSKNGDFLTLIVLLPLGVPSFLVAQGSLDRMITHGDHFLWAQAGLLLLSFSLVLALSPFVIRQALDGQQ